MIFISYFSAFFTISRVISILGEETEEPYFYTSVAASSISLASNTNYVAIYSDNVYGNMSLEKRRSLCTSALNHVTFPPTKKEQYIFKPQLYEYEVWYNGVPTTMVKLAINCRSYPSLYLGLNLDSSYVLVGNKVTHIPTDKKIQLIFLQDPQYSFLEEIVTNISLGILVAPSFWHTWNEFYNYVLDQKNRWNLCLAAKDHIHQKIEFITNHSQNSAEGIDMKVYEARMDSRNYSQPFIKCPTIPSMYLTLTDSISRQNHASKKVVEVIFVESDLQNHELYD